MQQADSIPWPQRGDQLFQAGEDWQSNACFNFSREQWNLYCIGFLRGAESLAEKVVGEAREVDVLVIPIIYMYRHYIELRLKDIIRLGQYLVNQTQQIPAHHDLQNLWSMARKLIQQIELDNGEDRTLDVVECHIHEFAGIDRKSLTFRYPVSKDGRTTEVPFDVINIANLKTVMEKLSSFLEAASSMMYEYRSIKTEMELEYAKYFE